MQTYEDVINKHEAIKQQVEDAPNTVHLEQIMSLLKETRQAGATTAEQAEREALRDVLRHWGNYLNTNYDVYPDMHIASFAVLPTETDTPTANKPLPPVESTQPIQISSQSVDPGFGQLKWVVALMLGMVVLFFVVQVIFPPVQAAEEVPETAVSEDLIATAIAATSIALDADETAIFLSLVPTETATSAIIYVTATLSPIPQIEVIEHTVATGDTLFSIAKQYNLTIAAIQETNNLDSETITTGDVLRIEIVATPETAVSPADTSVSQTTSAPDNNAVIRGNTEAGITNLRVAPEETAETIQSLPQGSFVYAVGQTNNGVWLLLELNGRSARGWVPATEVGLLYPFTPAEIPIIQTP